MKSTDFAVMKQAGQKISMVTCYDYWSAQIIATSFINAILVGDSLAMVMQGHASTIPATLDTMVLHTQAVARGAGKKLLVSDLPFLSYRKGLVNAMNAVERLMQAGAQAVKLEGLPGNEKIIQHIVQSGVPVMGHLGLTPQSICQLGGFKVQATDSKAADQLLNQTLALQEAGCFAIVLECVPHQVAQAVTAKLTIPTIGIGAGPYVDGQVLVLHDLLGLQPNFKPKFLKTYLDGFTLIQTALNHYHQEVQQHLFPSLEQSY